MPVGHLNKTGLEKMGISFEMPVGHLNKTGLEIPFYARWALLFDRLCLLKKITLILMTPDWCRDEMPVGHYFLTGFAWLCLALLGFAWLCLALIQASL